MDRGKLAEQLLKDWMNLLKEYNSDWQGNQVPEKFKKPFLILQQVFVVGNSIRGTAEMAGLCPSTVKRKYVDRYLSTYQKYALLGEIPESVNILKEAFDRKAGRPRKDYEELARQLKEGNPLLWERLIKALSTYRVRGKDGKPIFVSFSKIRKQLGEEIENFLGERVNQKTLWGKFIDAVIRVEFGSWWKFYARVLDYKTYMQFVGSQKAKARRLPESLGFGWEWEIDITELKVDGNHYYCLAVLDTYTRRFLGYRLKEKEPNKSYNDAFDRYDVGSFLRELFERYGVPKGFKMDNGKNFLAEYVQSALDYLGVEVFLSRPYAGWQKRIERAFGELKDWLLTPQVVEEEPTAEGKIARAFELYNSDKKEPSKVSNNFAKEVKEETLAFAFYEKELRKVRNGYVSIFGVSFFVGHLLEENAPSLRRGRKKETPEVLIAIDPQNLTVAYVYVSSSKGEFEWENQKWEFVGIARADSALPADERTLTQKAKKVRKKRTLKRKAEKLYQKLNKVQSELIEGETRPAKDELDKWLSPDELEELPTYSDEELLPPKEVLENEPLEVPIFRSPVHDLKWLQEHQHDLHRIKPADLKRLAKGLSQIRVSSLPPAKREFFEQIKAKIQKEVMSHA